MCGTADDRLVVVGAIMEAFFEPNWETGKHIPWKFSRRDGEPFAVAGLWERWRGKGADHEVVSYTLLTVNADEHPVMQRMHKPGQEKRMLALLDPAEYDEWLERPPAAAFELLRRTRRSCWSTRRRRAGRPSAAAHWKRWPTQWSRLNSSLYDTGSGLARRRAMGERPDTLRVLVADDDELVAKALARALPLLSSRPIAVVVACHGKQALELVTRVAMRPHAVILDIEMPGMGGVEAATAIRKELGDAAPLLIAIGGNSGAVEYAAGSGLFDHALHKPVDAEELVVLLQSQ